VSQILKSENARELEAFGIGPRERAYILREAIRREPVARRRSFTLIIIVACALLSIVSGLLRVASNAWAIAVHGILFAWVSRWISDRRQEASLPIQRAVMRERGYAVCTGCGYNLHALPIDTPRCPECAAILSSMPPLGTDRRPIPQLPDSTNALVIALVAISGVGTFELLSAMNSWGAWTTARRTGSCIVLLGAITLVGMILFQLDRGRREKT